MRSVISFLRRVLFDAVAAGNRVEERSSTERPETVPQSVPCSSLMPHMPK